MMRVFPKRPMFLLGISFITVFVLYVKMSNDTCFKINEKNVPREISAQPKEEPPWPLHNPGPFEAKNEAPPPPNSGSFEVDAADVDELLVSEFVPNTVFYVFCLDMQLFFHQYMSILSVIRHLRPDAIVFFYDYVPNNYRPFYNTFYDELKEYPSFRTIKVNTTVACENYHKPRLEFIYSLLEKWGGWYIHETTMITWYTASLRSNTIIDGLNRETHTGFLMAQRGLRLRKEGLDAVKKKYYHMNMNCTDNHTYTHAPQDNKPFCLILEGPFFPVTFMTMDNDFGKLSRLIFYQSEEIPVPKPDYSELIPNIAHMVWIGDGYMDFLFYLSILSLIYVAKVDRVYIHGDAPPVGMYWDKIKNNPKLRYVYRKPPQTIFGQQVTDRLHVTDIWRVEFMIRYGGIYIDTDSVILKPLPLETRAYDAVASFDWTYWEPPFPNKINFGVTAGKRGAKFWHFFRETFKVFKDDDWYWNGLLRPYQVWERNPELLKIDPHLQVSYMLRLI